MKDDLVLQLDLLVEWEDPGEGVEPVAEQRRIAPHAERVVPQPEAREARDIARLVRLETGQDLATEGEHDRAEKEHRSEGGADRAAIAPLGQAEQQINAEPRPESDQPTARFGGEQSDDDETEHGDAAAKEEPAFARRRPCDAAAAQHRAHGKEIRRVIAIRKRPEPAPAEA